jgi:hypothetical protein
MSECNLLESEETSFSESENAKITGENNVDVIFLGKGIMHHEFMPGKQTVNSKFIKS